MEDWKTRLAEETLGLAKKTNKLNDFMRTNGFYELNREDKDLLYEQYRCMITYLQILGFRCEKHGIKLSIKEIEKGEENE